MLSSESLEKQLQLKLPSKFEKLATAYSEQQKIKIFMKRDDLIHPIVCGNKWRKLKYNFLEILHNNSSQIISFGGAWSNHLHALAWCCKHFKIQLTAFVRGEPGLTPSAMIADIVDWGTTVKWLDRQQYRSRSDPDWINQLQLKYPQAVIIPEGGSNPLALKGVRDLVEEILNQATTPVDYVCAAVGSGGTLSGLIEGFQDSKTQLIGIPVVKGKSALENRIRGLLQHKNINNWRLIDGYERGGYARYDQQVANFIRDFKQQHNILLEPIYTAKLLIAVEDLIKRQFFKTSSTIVVIHSGGLQGLRGSSKFNLNKISISNN